MLSSSQTARQDLCWVWQTEPAWPPPVQVTVCCSGRAAAAANSTLTSRLHNLTSSERNANEAANEALRRSSRKLKLLVTPLEMCHSRHTHARTHVTSTEFCNCCLIAPSAETFRAVRPADRLTCQRASVAQGKAIVSVLSKVKGLEAGSSNGIFESSSCSFGYRRSR